MPPSSQYEILRADPAIGLELGADSIDRKTATIGGASIIQKGIVKDNRFEIDDETLQQIVKKGNQTNLGIKTRFGHPSMSDDALGTFLGRSKNFRIDPETDLVRADIHFDPTSFTSPNGDLGGYVLGLGESDPKAFGMSVVVKGRTEFRVNKDGTKEKNEETGEQLPPLLRVDSLLGTDFVDSPAATNGLFGMNDQTMISGELMVKLEELMERPEFVNRAYVFFNRAFDLLGETQQPEPKIGGSTMADGENFKSYTSIEELTKENQGLVKEFQVKVEENATGKERTRAKQIIEFAQSMKCEVGVTVLAAITEGFNVDKAGNEFLKVELATRDQEANDPTGLKGETMPEKTQEFTDYTEAWQTIKRIENCSSADAMRRAQDRFPKLYSQFLASCPKGSI